MKKTRCREIIDHRMPVASRHFLSLPESEPGNLTRDHILKLDGVEVEGYLTDNVTEVWIDFRYKGHSFTINNQFGEYWFFVDDIACPEAVLQIVAEHFTGFLNRR